MHYFCFLLAVLDTLWQKTAQNNDAILELNNRLIEIAEVLFNLSEYAERDVPSYLRYNVVGLVEQG